MKTALIVFLFTTSAFAGTLDSFKGDWKEVSWRCPGDKTTQPRPSQLDSDKFLSIGDNGTYFHRVQIYDMKSCSSVQSAGTLTGIAKGNMTAVKVMSQLNVSCHDGSSTLVDDFTGQIVTPFNLYLDSSSGTQFLVFNGDSTYVDPSCQGGLIERLYQTN